MCMSTIWERVKTKNFVSAQKYWIYTEIKTHFDGIPWPVPGGDVGPVDSYLLRTQAPGHLDLLVRRLQATLQAQAIKYRDSMDMIHIFLVTSLHHSMPMRPPPKPAPHIKMEILLHFLIIHLGCFALLILHIEYPKFFVDYAIRNPPFEKFATLLNNRKCTRLYQIKLKLSIFRIFVHHFSSQSIPVRYNIPSRHIH